jgi:hypothetical protein
METPPPGRCGAVLANYYKRYKQEKAHTRIPEWRQSALPASSRSIWRNLRRKLRISGALSLERDCLRLGGLVMESFSMETQAGRTKRLYATFALHTVR